MAVTAMILTDTRILRQFLGLVRKETLSNMELTYLGMIIDTLVLQFLSSVFASDTRKGKRLTPVEKNRPTLIQLRNHVLHAFLEGDRLTNHT